MTLDSRSQPKQFFQNFLLAGTIGAFSKTLITPLETKIIYSSYINSDGTSYFNQMLKEQGRIALWKDNGLKLKYSFPSQGFNFAFFDFFKNTFCSSIDPKTEFCKFLSSHMAAGAAAGGLSLLILYPLNLSKPNIKSVGDVQKKPSFSKEEILKRYKWFNISAVGAMVYRRILFGGYETAKKVIFPERKEKSFVGKYSTVLGVAIFVGKYLTAFSVAIFAVLLSTPVDFVRRRMMMKFSVTSDGETVQYKSALDCARRIYNEQGWKAFMRVTRLSWISTISASLNLVLYDELKALLFENKNARI